jgi:hypothetical protein
LISSFEGFFLFFFRYCLSHMDPFLAVSFPEGTIPLLDSSFLRMRYFQAAWLRKPILARLRPLLEKYHITLPTTAAATKLREVLAVSTTRSSEVFRAHFQFGLGVVDNSLADARIAWPTPPAHKAARVRATSTRSSAGI